MKPPSSLKGALPEGLRNLPGVCSIMAVCIAAAACKAGTSWPLGHILLLSNGAEVHACYVGADKSKLFFLVDCKQCDYPLVTVVATTVDSVEAFTWYASAVGSFLLENKRRSPES